MVSHQPAGAQKRGQFLTKTAETERAWYFFFDLITCCLTFEEEEKAWEVRAGVMNGFLSSQLVQAINDDQLSEHKACKRRSGHTCRVDKHHVDLREIPNQPTNQTYSRGNNPEETMSP